MATMNIHARHDEVTVDGETRLVDLAALGFDPEILSLHWDGAAGLISFMPQFRATRAPELGELPFTDLTPYQPILDAWAVAPAPPAPPPRAANPRLQDIPDTVNSVPEIRVAVNSILAYLRGE